MFISGWGNYPVVNCNPYYLTEENMLSIFVSNQEIIPFGKGRSYGDSALSKNIIFTSRYSGIISFDDKTGILEVKSGTMLKDIIEKTVSKGWFLPVTPGTKYITVGGAISSDVHGKNHHIDGCFSEFVEEIKIMLPSGEILNINKNQNLFRAVCGGMGLVGIILEAKIKLVKIKSKNIFQRVYKTYTMEQLYSLFKNFSSQKFSVAWVDIVNMEKGKIPGLFITGSFLEDGDLSYKNKTTFNVPFYFPSMVLNNFSVRMFNRLYFSKFKQEISESIVDIDEFFYPLDHVGNWNRIYGRRGFLQYQFIVPLKNGPEAIDEIVYSIQKRKIYPYLSVLKLYGKENQNYLSFPMEGYSLAMDFKIQKGLFEVLDEFDRIILKHGGRIYLAKDSRMSRSVFESSYKNIDAFKKIKKEVDPKNQLSSLQSKRLGL